MPNDKVKKAILQEDQPTVAPPYHMVTGMGADFDAAAALLNPGDRNRLQMLLDAGRIDLTMDMPPGQLGGYKPFYGQMRLNHKLAAENHRKLARVLAHEIQHSRQGFSSPQYPLPTPLRVSDDPYYGNPQEIEAYRYEEYLKKNPMQDAVIEMLDPQSELRKRIAKAILGQ